MWWLRKKEVSPSTNDVQVMNALVSQSFGHVRRDVQNLYDWMRHVHNQHQDAKREIDDHKRLVAHQRDEITQLRRIVDEIPKSKQEIKALVDEFYRIEAILDRITKVEEAIEHAKRAKEAPLPSMSMHQDAHYSMASHAPIPHMLPQQVSVVQQPVAQAHDEAFKRLAELSERSNQLMIEKLSELSTRIDAKKSPQSALKEKIISRVARNSKEYVKSMIRQLIDKYGKASGLQLREIVVEEQGLASKSSFYRLLTEIEEDGDITVIREGKEKVYLSKSQKGEQWVQDGR